MRRYEVTVTTDASGDATRYTPTVRGHLESIQYVKTDYADGVDFTITDDATGESLWTQTNVNAAVIVRPRGATHTPAGAAILYASGGVAVNEKIGVSGRVKIVVAQGGNVKTGKFVITVS